MSDPSTAVNGSQVDPCPRCAKRVEWTEDASGGFWHYSNPAIPGEATRCEGRMRDAKIVTEHELNVWAAIQANPEPVCNTIRILALAVEGKWHDGECELDESAKSGDAAWCHCNRRLLEAYHA